MWIGLESRNCAGAGAGYRHSGLEDAATSIERENGFSSWLASKGLGTTARAVGNFIYAGGVAAASELLGVRRPAPVAIFTANDLMALGIIDVARNVWGIKVPSELAVVGFDDIAVSSYPGYDLTTFRQPVAEMISAAVNLMTRLTREPSDGFVDIRQFGKLVARGSVSER